MKKLTLISIVLSILGLGTLIPGLLLTFLPEFNYYENLQVLGIYLSGVGLAFIIGTFISNIRLRK